MKKFRLLPLALLFFSAVNAQEGAPTKTNEFEAALQVAQSQFNNWSGGGENTFSGRGALRYKFDYKKDKLNVTFNSAASYGMNVIEGDAFKNEDEFSLNLLTTYAIKSSNWSYAGSANVRSQFTNGYASREDDTLLSTFFAPGYIDLSVGFSYKKPDSPFTLVLSPVAGSITIVGNEELSLQGAYGVDPGEHVRAELGASADARYDKKFAKDIMHYRSKLYLFTSYSKDPNPTMQWDNSLDIVPTKWLSITLLAKIYYDEYANIEHPNRLQFNYGFSIGLSYLFKSK